MVNAIYRINRYRDTSKDEWNIFVRSSKNSLFMFDRSYMEYHSDRFDDFSLMFYKNEKLIAVMPANVKGDTVYSHGGLTFGGLVAGNGIRQADVNECIETLILFLRDNGIKELLYKTIPYVYHKQPAEEDRYALFQHGASIREVSASTVINLENPLKYSHGRKENIKKANRDGVVFKECFDKNEYDLFVSIESEILQKRHGVKIVHSGDELFMLHERFPRNIHLFAGFINEEMIAGAVIYEYATVVHTQYMAANDVARTNGALDYIMNEIIERYKYSKKWLDFGISTESGGKYLNEGLISQKEGFGGRTIVYELWELNL